MECTELTPNDDACIVRYRPPPETGEILKISVNTRERYVLAIRPENLSYSLTGDATKLPFTCGQPAETDVIRFENFQILQLLLGPSLAVNTPESESPLAVYVATGIAACFVVVFVFVLRQKHGKRRLQLQRHQISFRETNVQSGFTEDMLPPTQEPPRPGVSLPSTLTPSMFFHTSIDKCQGS